MDLEDLTLGLEVLVEDQPLSQLLLPEMPPPSQVPILVILLTLLLLPPLDLEDGWLHLTTGLDTTTSRTILQLLQIPSTILTPTNTTSHSTTTAVHILV